MAVGAGTGSGQGRGGATSVRGVTIRGEVKNYVPVTPEMLKNPPAGDWLIFRRNYLGHSYSPLDQITRDNVHNLQLAWVWAMNDTGANQTTPIVHNGIIYLASPSNIVQALDGKTGDLIWETRVGPDQAPGYGGIRSIAIAQDKVFLPTSNAHMVALSARTGDILWDTPLSDVKHPSTSGAIVIGDNVLQGITGCGRNAADGCFISAIDINTGKRAWRFHTIPREGEPGYDTWGKLPKESRAGVETWIAGSYDPELNLTYWGTAQSKPWSFLNRGTTPIDKTLYSSSTLALNAGSPGSSPGISSMRPVSRSTSTRCSSGCSSTSARRKCRSAPARPAFCGSSIGAPDSSWATRRWWRRPSGSASIPKRACRATGPTFSKCSSIRR